jgi:hypothetical protein
VIQAQQAQLDRQDRQDLKVQLDQLVQQDQLEQQGHKVPLECPQIHSAHFYLSSTKKCYLADKKHLNGSISQIS